MKSKAHSMTLGEVHSPESPFGSLLNDPKEFERVYSSLEHTIFESCAIIDKFIWGKDPKITQEEVKRRFLICEKWFRILRTECGYGVKRTLDTIPKALAAELLETEFDPMEGVKQGWSPNTLSLGEVLKKTK